MNKTGILIACCLCVCAGGIARAQGLTVGIVDMEELVRLHPNTASDEKLLEQTIKDYRAENEEMRQKIEALQEDFDKIRKEAADPALSDKAKKAVEERAGKARDALVLADRTAREKMQTRQEQVNEMRTRMLKKTFGELRDVIGKYADERKIQIVLPANQVVYNAKTLDMTDAILKQMNVTRPAQAKEGAAATPAPVPSEAKPAIAPTAK